MRARCEGNWSPQTSQFSGSFGNRDDLADGEVMGGPLQQPGNDGLPNHSTRQRGAAISAGMVENRSSEMSVEMLSPASAAEVCGADEGRYNAGTVLPPGAFDVQSIRAAQTADPRAKQTHPSGPARRAARVNKRLGDGGSPGSMTAGRFHSEKVVESFLGQPPLAGLPPLADGSGAQRGGGGNLRCPPEPAPAKAGGLKNAIAAVFAGASWQRCRTHFMANLLTRVPKGAQPGVATIVRTIYQQLSPAEVHGQLDRVVEQLREPFPQVAELWISPRCRSGLRTSARASQRTTPCWEARRAGVTPSEATSRSGTGSCGPLLLEYMAVAGMTASGMVAHLFDLVGEHRYERRDVGFNSAHRAAIMERLSGEPLTDLAGMPVRGMDEIDGRRWMLDVGWVAARFSGTEPLLRIYREVDTTPNVTRLLDAMQAHPGV